MLDHDEDAVGELEQFEPMFEAASYHQKLEERFEKAGSISSGGMSNVHAGTDRRTGKKVAIKLMRHGLAHNEEAVTMFGIEASLLERFAGRSVGKMISCGFYRGTPAIVLRRYSLDLGMLQLKEGVLGPKLVLRAASTVLGVLQRLHAAGCVHRDVKPANLLLDDRGTVHLVDFGVAMHEEYPVSLGLRRVGTPGYSAPEAFYEDNASPSSDLFSLGATMFVLSTGHTGMMLYVPNMREMALESLPEELRSIVDLSTRLSLAERYAGASEMKAEVDRQLRKISRRERRRTC